MARQFIIEDQGRYYVCELQMEYDPKTATTPEEQQGVKQVAAMYAEARKRGSTLNACEVGSANFTESPLNTGPSF